MRLASQSKLFVDTGDPAEARAVQELLMGAGYDGLDGATTNPSYFAKNPSVQARLEVGDKFTERELLAAYRDAAQEIERILPGGDISVEVYADASTSADDMISQARELYSWIPTARIKLPIIEQGLFAAEQLKSEMRLNMTLCFSQQQAAAVYAVTQGAAEPVVLSPFIGRLDDRGENGAQFVGNVVKMLGVGDGHVQILAASFRSVDNVVEMLRAGADILTINLERFELWAQEDFRLPDENFVYRFDGKDIPYEALSLDKPWGEYDIHHELTDVGLQKFADDWNALLT